MSTQNTDFQDNRTIFVNGLSSTVGESELYKIVDEATDGKSILNVHINRDQSRFETSIAYINMSTHEAAKTVIAKLNGKIIQGKKINMSWSMKDYKQRTQNDANLYVKGIKREITQQKLQETFEQFGEILSCKLSTNEKNESNGFGYVKYIDVEVAKKVIEAKDQLKQTIGDEAFTICNFEKQPTAAQTNLYIGNIDKSITEEQFIKYFETFGKIKEQNGKKCYNYAFVEKYNKYRGFVNYENSEDASKALIAPKDKVLGESELVVAYYKSKQDRKREWQQKANEIKTNCMNKYKEFNLYVNTKQTVTTEQEVRELLQECGTIYSLKVKYYSHEPTGVAYVCFTDAESTAKAIEKCKAHGWDCNKLITKTERMTQNYPYNVFHGYNMYPLNYFQYLSLFPQMFMNQKYPRMPKQQRDDRQGDKKKGQNRKNVHQQKPNEKKEEKPVEKKQEQPKVVEKEVVTEDMRNDLGDKLYDYILSMGYDEDLTGRITGVLLESLEYADLKKKIETDKDELKKIIEEVKVTLANMENEDQN